MEHIARVISGAMVMVPSQVLVAHMKIGRQYVKYELQMIRSDLILR